MRFANTFQAQTPIGAAIQNLSNSFFDGPSPLEQQKLDMDNRYRQSSIDNNASEIAARNAKTQANAGLANLLGPLITGPVPEGMDRGTYIANGMAPLAGNLAQGDNLGDIGNLIRTIIANAPGTTDNQVVRAQAGAGGTLGVNDAVSIPGQAAVAARNQGDAIGLANVNNAADLYKAMSVLKATPLTEGQVKGGLLTDMLPGLTEDQQRVVVGAQNAYNGTIVQGEDGTTRRIDSNSPYAIATPVPGIVETSPGHGGPRPVPPTAGLQALNVSTSTTNDPAARRSREQKAASLGITLQQLDFMETVDAQARNNLAGFSGLDKETRDLYGTIMQTVKANLNRPTAAATTYDPLPADYKAVP